MAKTSLIVKNHRKPKYKVREYTRCERCGRPHAVLSKFKLCQVFVLYMLTHGNIHGIV